jgi:hypothetical protein
MIPTKEIPYGIKEANAVADALNTLKNRFLQIHVGSRYIPCPFFMNHDYLYKGTPHYQTFPGGGKLTPDEIETHVKECATQEEIRLDTLNPEQLTTFFLHRGIGVDCSGLVYQCLQRAFMATHRQPFESVLTNIQGAFGITKIGVSELQLPHNSYVIDDIRTIQPADFITFGISHCIAIIDVSDRIIHCLHASNEIAASGVHPFDIRILDPNASLAHQHWNEHTMDGKPYDEFLHTRKNKPIIRRLHVLTPPTHLFQQMRLQATGV